MESELPFKIARHRTAIGRRKLSRPMAQALEDSVLRPGMTVLDYGCGRGSDVGLLNDAGFQTAGWDPKYRPDAARTPADVVNLGFVINVIERPEERVAVLLEAYTLARLCLVVSAQLVYDANTDTAIPFGDGVLTRRDTFQKYYTQDELRSMIDGALGVEPIPAAPGIFYIFRDELHRQELLVRKISHRRVLKVRTVLTLEEKLAPHRELLQDFAQQVSLLGRLPRPSEFASLGDLKERLGSPGRCVRLCEQVFEGFNLETARRGRSEDLLIYIALSRFRRRPRFSDLPESLQWDIRDLFGSYQRACELGDELLFRVGQADAIDAACRGSSLGKLLPTALYVHASCADLLPPLLRVYLGCARAYVGEIKGANLLKIHRFTGKISYLSYPEFDRVPHPALAQSLTVNLRSREILPRDYSTSENPPILHRKETLVDSAYPCFEKFTKLTQAEEKAGLLEETSGIGLRKGWEELVASKGLRLHGHRLVRKSKKQ